MPSIASKSYKAGDIISDCEPLFVCLNEEFRNIYCNNCLKSTSLKRCSKCKKSYYCGKECQINDWKYHKKECELYSKFKVLDLGILRVLLRFMLCLKSDPEFGTRRHQLVNGSDICLNEIEVDDIYRAELLTKNSEELTYFGLICFHFKTFGLQFENKEIHRSFRLCFSRIVYPIKHYHTKKPYLLYKDMDNPIGYGFYISTANVCHSCLPNSGFVSNGTTLQLRAMASIESGQEMTVTFVGLAQNKEERNKCLSRYLTKECNCDKCRLNLDKDFDYNRLKDLMKVQMNHWNRIGSGSNSGYLIDSQMINGLRHCFGRYNPLTTEWIVMSFICFADCPESRNSYLLALWFTKISKMVAITHGKSHPLHSLLEHVFNQSA